MTGAKLVAALSAADEAYAAGKPIMSDANYDRLRSRLATEDPDNRYLQTVGSAARARREKLPIIVGSLSKLRPEDVAKWAREVEKRGGKQRGWLCLPKFDGQSVTVEYRDNRVTRAWTRGEIDGGVSVGQNVTEAAKCVQGVRPLFTPCDAFDLSRERILVRGEVIMHNTMWDRFYKGQESDLGKTYKNPRNMCAGLLNRLNHEDVRKDLGRCTFVALQLFRQRANGSWVRPSSAHREWVMLTLMGFTTGVNPTRYAPGHRKIVSLVRDGHECLRRVLPVHDTQGGIGDLAYWDHAPTAEEVVERLSSMRKIVDIRLDGLVIQPVDAGEFIRAGEHLATRPFHVMSIKLEAHDQEFIDGYVGEIDWRISKRGLLKPRVKLRDSLDFDGVDVEYATANNAANVVKWGLRAGRPIRMVRSGDVIPRIVAVRNREGWQPLTVIKRVRQRGGTMLTKRVDGPGIEDAAVMRSLPTECPDCGTRLRWNDSRVDLWCSNENCSGRLQRSVTTFFKILGVDDVASGTIQHLIDAGMTTIPDILNRATPARLARIEGYAEKKAATVANAIEGALRDAPLYKIMHASGAFSDEQSALGSTKLRDILDVVGPGMIERATPVELRKALARLKGLGPTGLKHLLDGLEEWRELWVQIKKHHSESQGPKTLSGIRVAFTGFRDAVMEVFVEKAGGSVGGLSAKTTVLFSATPDSTKAKRADQLGIQMVSQAEAWQWLKVRAGDK